MDAIRPCNTTEAVTTEEERERRLQQTTTDDTVIEKFYFVFCLSEYSNECNTYNCILAEMISIYVQNTFEDFIKKLNIPFKPSFDKLPPENIAHLKTELQKICYRRMDESTPSYIMRKSLVFFASRQFLFYKYKKITNITYLPFKFVPDLFDIMRNCHLFDNVKTDISEIMDAYPLIKYVCIGNRYLFRLKLKIQQLIDVVDDELLPNKQHFRDKLNRLFPHDMRQYLDPDKEKLIYVRDGTENRQDEIQIAYKNSDSELNEKKSAVEIFDAEGQSATCSVENELKPKQSLKDKVQTLVNKMLESDSDQDSDTELSGSSVDPSVQADLDDPQYHNWVKGTLSCKYVSEGTRCFILTVFKKFQQQTLPNGGSHFEDGEYIKKMCEEGVRWRSSQWKYPAVRIHCNDCKSLFDEVDKLHRAMNSPKSGFHNCKKIQVGGAWGIAKLFMPANCGDVRKPEDLDTLGLFHTMSNCDLFSKCSYECIDKIINSRNKMMHSRTLAMTDDLITVLYDSEIQFLDEAIDQLSDDDNDVRQELISSKKNVEQIRSSEMKIELMIERTKEAIQYECEDIERNKDQDVDGTKKEKLIEKQDMLQTKIETYESSLHSAPEKTKRVAKSKKNKIAKLMATVDLSETLDNLQKTQNELEEKRQDLKRAEEQYNEIKEKSKKAEWHLRTIHTAIKKAESDLKIDLFEE